MLFGLLTLGGPSVVAGFGPALFGAMPGGVFVSVVVDDVVPVDGVDVSVEVFVAPLVVGLVEGDVDVSLLVGAGVGVPETEALPVVVVVEDSETELSVFGVSGLLQALSAANAVKVAAMAI
jgi:hypothetical protein